MNIPSTMMAAWATALASPWSAAGQDASAIFERYSHAVVKLEVVEARSDAPNGVATAFFVDESLLLTNYHVVRPLLFEPTDYRLRLVSGAGPWIENVRIVGVDPTSDLAVLRVPPTGVVPLRLSSDSVAVGQTLFSLGHPSDLQTAVVAGVFNGRVVTSVAPLAHFAGSINPGMSGGPALTAAGDVVGINVSTAGNQLSFLVPARSAAALVAGAGTVDSVTTEDLLEQANRRLYEFQETFFAGLGAGGMPTTRLGRASVPTSPTEQIDCEADPHEIPDDRYELTEYRCSSEDRMMLGQHGWYDLIYLEHMHISAEALSTFAFHSLASEWYRMVYEWEAPQNEDATEFRCRAANLRDGLEAEMLVNFCTRGHVSHEGMFDLFLRSATIRSGTEAVVSTLRAGPISHANAVALAQRWLRAFSWN